MFLKWFLPIQIYILANDRFQHSFKINFEYKEMQCEVEFIEGSSGQSIRLNNTIFNYFISEKITFTIEDAPESNKISQLIENRKALTKLMFQLTNRVLKNARVHGVIPNLHELVIMDEHYEDYLLDSLKPSYSSDTLNWTNVSDLVVSALNNVSRYPDLINNNINSSYYLDYYHWEKVKEKIISNAPIPTELDLYLNAIEHLRTKNYRLSILESVIGLEVALTGFLREYLANHKKFSKKKIDDFLKPEFGLTARLSGLLDLTINQKSLEEVSIETVKKVVNWRNKIVHSLGQIQEGVSEQQIEQGIEQVLKLLIILHNKKNIVLNFPGTKLPSLF